MDVPSSPREDPLANLSTPMKRDIVTLKRHTNYSNREIARRLNIDESTVRYQLNQEAQQHTSRTVGKHKAGRYHKIDQETVMKMIKNMEGHYSRRIETFDQMVKRFNLGCSAKTLKREMNAKGYFKCKACQKSALSELNRTRRWDFADKYRHWEEEWKQVLYTDECHFETTQRRTELVLRNKQERYCEDCTQYRKKKANTTWSVWAGIGYDYKTPLVFYTKNGPTGGFTQENYLNEILKPHIEPRFKVLKGLGFPFQLLEDNDNAHGTRSVENPCRDYIKAKGIECIENYPAHSPDFNPIENVWRILKQRVKQRKATNAEELKRFILEEWHKITQAEINKYVMQMRARMQQACEREGRRTQY